MDGYSVHFEVFVRKLPGAAWTLDTATENRNGAIDQANELMAEGRVAAVKVTKETFDEEAREYRAVVILKLGAADNAAKSKPQADVQPLCVTPQDLYTVHARERIGRLLEGWLERNNATPFELLHRPDLVENLEASGTDLQHAIQKIAIPEAHARGMSVHELIRVFHTLIERAVDKLMKDAKRGVLPSFKKESFAACADRLSNDPERGYLLGAGVADALSGATSQARPATGAPPPSCWTWPTSGPSRGAGARWRSRPCSSPWPRSSRPSRASTRSSGAAGTWGRISRP